ncbi:MAG: hypothetical protein ACJAUT_000337 [Cellvibrionaceae bacterium]|jgi:hypothetical protein
MMPKKIINIKKIVENLAELANTNIMKNQKVMRLINAYFHLNPLLRFNTSLIPIIAFIALFKTFVVDIYNNLGILAAFLKVSSTTNQLSLLVKQLSQHFVNSSLIFGGLFYDNG